MSQTQTPEAAAIPATPATPTPAPATIVSALFAFLQTKAGNPLEQGALSQALAYVTAYEPQLASLLGASGPLTVKSVIDQVFTFAESKAQRPFVQYVLRGLNVLVDGVGLPALQIYLASVGIALPLS